MAREQDATLGSVRLPSSLLERLERVHLRTRIPKSELVRYFLSTGLDAADFSTLAVDVAEDLHERGLSSRTETRSGPPPRTRSHAA